MTRRKPVSTPADAQVIEAPTIEASPPTTGETLMRLRTRITSRTGAPWYNLAMINPLFAEQPFSPFVVKLRQPGESVWVGQWPPDVDDATLDAIVDELLAMKEVANAVPPVEVDEDGETVGDPKVEGKQVTLRLANGESVTVVPRRVRDRETATQQEQRLRGEIDAAPKIKIFHTGDAEFVSWNNIDQWIFAGENDVPKQLADQYYATRLARNPMIDIEARMQAHLPPLPTWQELQRFVERETNQ